MSGSRRTPRGCPRGMETEAYRALVCTPVPGWSDSQKLASNPKDIGRHQEPRCRPLPHPGNSGERRSVLARMSPQNRRTRWPARPRRHDRRQPLLPGRPLRPDRRRPPYRRHLPGRQYLPGPRSPRQRSHQIRKTLRCLIARLPRRPILWSLDPTTNRRTRPMQKSRATPRHTIER
jgi:hypothetical protein